MTEPSSADRPVMLITGTSKGIGKHLAHHYLLAGYRVVGCSRSAAEIASTDYEHVRLDICNEAQVVDLFSMLGEKHGRLDALINNAGISYLSPAMITSADVAQAALHTNVLGPFLFCREAGRLMRRKKTGRIVNFSSVAVPLRSEGQALYAASKAALVTLTQVLAKEYAPLGITVNAVGPSLIKTEMTTAMPEKMIEKNLQAQAIKRLGEFRDVANVVDFFLRPESDFVTGQVIYLAGM